MVTVSVLASGEEGFSTMASLVRTILVVEHDPSECEPVTRHFSSKPHQYAKVVTSAAAALNFVRHIKPNLFLLEHHLPYTDGLALYDLLHETEELASIPAILFDIPLSTQAHAVIKTQRLVPLGTLIELEGLGIDIEEVIMGGTLAIQTLVKQQIEPSGQKVRSKGMRFFLALPVPHA